MTPACDRRWQAVTNLPAMARIDAIPSFAADGGGGGCGSPPAVVSIPCSLFVL
jgi:hypothetical protein